MQQSVDYLCIEIGRDIVKKILFIFALLMTTGHMMAEDLDSIYTRDMLPIGTLAPDMPVDSTGELRLSDLRGRYVVLHFWASWCPDCRRDMPLMNQLSFDYSSDSIVFVHISYDTDKQQWIDYLNKNPMAGLQVSELKKMREAETYKLFHLQWIPAIYLLNPAGEIIFKTVEAQKLKNRLQQINLSNAYITTNKINAQVVSGVTINN